MDQRTSLDSRSPRGRRVAAALAAMAMIASLGACTEADDGSLQFALGGGTITNGTILIASSGAQTEVGDTGVLTLGDGPFGADPDFELSLVHASAVTNGGTAAIEVSAPTAFSQLSIMASELDHHFLIDLAAPTDSALLLVTVDQAYRDPFVTFEISAGDGVDYGPIAEATFGVVQVGSGDVQVSLTFDRGQDVDLWVRDPTGDLLYWGTDPGEPDDVASGGVLDLDANAGCTRTDERAENITWPTGTGISGTYTVYLQLFGTCGDLVDVNWVITVSVKGRSPEIFSGTLSAGDVGSEIEVTTFEGPEPL